jgi:type II secretion system protein N
LGGTSAVRIPRWLAITSYPVGAVVLTAFFIYLGFPYDLLSQRFARTLESATGTTVRIGELSPHIGLAGPGLAARQVVQTKEGGETIVLEELIVRPAWSLAWLRGDPAIHVDLTSDVGNSNGTLTLGRSVGFVGTLEAVQVAHLPGEMLELAPIDGILDATVDLQRMTTETGEELVGTVAFELRDGSLGGGAALPMVLPFERLYGSLHFGDDTFMTLEGVVLEGPLADATIEGTIGHGPAPAHQPLSIKAAYKLRDPALARKIGSIGKQGSDGRAHLAITGTLSRPVIR